MEDGKRVMKKILNLSLQERPDAVIAGSDEVAAGNLGVIEGLANGIRDRKILQFWSGDDQPLASCIQIPLWTTQPIAQEGEYAAKEMIRQSQDLQRTGS